MIVTVSPAASTSSRSMSSSGSGKPSPPRIRLICSASDTRRGSAAVLTAALLPVCEQPHAEQPRQALAAAAHDHVVVPREHRPCQGGEQVHPALGGLHDPLVGDRRGAVSLE